MLTIFIASMKLVIFKQVYSFRKISKNILKGARCLNGDILNCQATLSKIKFKFAVFLYHFESKDRDKFVIPESHNTTNYFAKLDKSFSDPPIFESKALGL